METENKVQRTFNNLQISKHDDNGELVLRNEQGHIIANMDVDAPYIVSKEESKVNAAFIVKACNNYEALMEALIKCSHQLYQWYHMDRWSDKDEEVLNECTELITAIKQAEL